MEKKELTNEKEKELKIKIINLLLLFNEKNEQDYNDKNSDLYKTFHDTDYQNSPSNISWWYESDKTKYNQKAHIILHLLSKKKLSTKGAISNKGFIFLLKYIINKNASISNDETLNIKNFFKNNIDEINKLEDNKINDNDINILLSYLALYFSEINNFETEGDFEKYNKPILDNLYDWYLKDISQDKIQECCNKLEEIVSKMGTMLNNNSDNSTEKNNLDCTINHTNKIINNLRNNLMY